jgi:predicted hotdog family 3-hydroxylacyl-ACP dehydratase
MIMLSRVGDYDTEKRFLQAEYDVGPDCLFYDPAREGVPSWVGLECMAQGVSALSGIINRQGGIKPKPGFILSVSNLELMVPLLASGAVLEIQVREDERMGAVYAYTGDFRVRGAAGSAPAGRAKLTVMEANAGFPGERP